MNEATLQLAKDGWQESARDFDAARAPHGAVAAMQPVDATRPVGPTADANAQRPEFFAQLLEDAERMLAHSAEAGIEVDQDIRSIILKASFADKRDQETLDQL